MLMPRPKLVSDDDVLEAAKRVMLRLGPRPFTLSDVADEVGLSRAALIQRFQNRAGLYLGVMRRANRQLTEAIAAAPGETGPEALWAFLTFMVGSMGDQDRLANQLLLVREDMVDPALNELARERNIAIRKAIAARLPPDLAPRAEGISGVIQAVLQGAVLQWGVERDQTLKASVLARLASMLAILFPHARFET